MDAAPRRLEGMAQTIDQRIEAGLAEADKAAAVYKIRLEVDRAAGFSRNPDLAEAAIASVVVATTMAEAARLGSDSRWRRMEIEAAAISESAASLLEDRFDAAGADDG